MIRALQGFDGILAFLARAAEAAQKQSGRTKQQTTGHLLNH